ncbi:hypothetical protein D3OALGA1CA_3790 [Olavius algarvensis associated proteobacterium Delta 3]|nr:hypothetical protein D3OALGA1CA_3790 [Olavius algarvensis associated proteobacterium Delta 3]
MNPSHRWCDQNFAFRESLSQIITSLNDSIDGRLSWNL